MKIIINNLFLSIKINYKIKLFSLLIMLIEPDSFCTFLHAFFSFHNISKVK